MTYDPGLGETEEFPNLSERVGVELEVVLFVSYVLLEDEGTYLERSTHTLGGQGGPNNVLNHTGRSLDPGLECLSISTIQKHRAQMDSLRGKRASELPNHQQRRCHRRRGWIRKLA
jgi:hypothetical protein